jgi:hypothetical protein
MSTRGNQRRASSGSGTVASDTNTNLTSAGAVAGAGRGSTLSGATRSHGVDADVHAAAISGVVQGAEYEALLELTEEEWSEAKQKWEST